MERFEEQYKERVLRKSIRFGEDIMPCDIAEIMLTYKAWVNVSLDNLKEILRDTYSACVAMYDCVDDDVFEMADSILFNAWAQD